MSMGSFGTIDSASARLTPATGCLLGATHEGMDKYLLMPARHDFAMQAQSSGTAHATSWKTAGESYARRLQRP